MVVVVAATPVSDDEHLTQYGCTTSDPVFRSHPRPEVDGLDISLIRGMLTVEAATMIVRRRGYVITGADVVRHTTAGTLRDAGFVVEHTPNRKNPAHVSVRWPGDWTDEVSKDFADCFEEEASDG
jgi:hypothetical protein